MSPNTAAFIKLVKHPIKFRIFLFSKLPSAFFSGLRIREIDQTKSIVSVPFKWFSQNPFGSTYFACLAMAAEMSTGILGLLHVYKRNPPVSMLVVDLRASFYKKAKDISIFTCEDGIKISDTVEKAINSKEGQTIVARSVGLNIAGELLAEFNITWSFKMKNLSI
jgi:hypothetical protein